MYKTVPFSKDLDLSEFYAKAKAKGYENNTSEFWIKDCFRNERESETWILYYNNKPVGSVAAHTFDEMGEYSYRIACRTCVFTDELSQKALRNVKKTILEHQNPTAQFLIPTCIEWAGRDKNLYITSNELEGGSQRLVHKIYFPALQKSGQVENCGEITYRGTLQTVWKLHVDKFYKELNKHERWI